MDRSYVGRIWEISPENYFYKTVVVLDSDEENEAKRLINVQGPNVQRECAVEASNANNKKPQTLIQEGLLGMIH